MVLFMLRLEDISDEYGKFLVSLARRAIEEYVRNGKRISPPKNTPSKLREKAGAFVTLNKIVDGEEELRGCIGYILPHFPLVEAVIDAAISAATRDPRFDPVLEYELESIVVEVTVLTPLQKIDVSNPNEYLEKIEIGKDGLLLEWKGFGGTLLPQVPVEYNWDVKTFLEHLCLKSGLPTDCWKWKDTVIYRYQGVIFKEKEPYGEIIRVELKKH